MESMLEKLNRYYIRNKGKKVTASYANLLQKAVDELNEQELDIYRTRIEPNMDYFIDILYQIFVEEGRPLDAWRQEVLHGSSILNNLAKKVVIRAVREQEQGLA